MVPRRFIGLAIGLLLVFGLLFVVPSMQQNAWMQGYLMGQLAGGKDASSAALLPYMMHGGGPGFGGFAFLLLIPLGILFFVGVGKFMRYRAWQQGYGPGGPQGWHGGPGGWHRYGPPPWAQGQGAPQGQEQPQNPDQPQGQPGDQGQQGTPPWGQGTPPWAAWQQSPWGQQQGTPPWAQWQTPPQAPPAQPNPGAGDHPTE
ncbi:MAG: hypothetical protein U0822_26825 [Anaerolineae bacterium]